MTACGRYSAGFYAGNPNLRGGILYGNRSHINMFVKVLAGVKLLVHY